MTRKNHMFLLPEHMAAVIDYNHLQDFTALPAVRDACKGQSQGLLIYNIPSIDLDDPFQSDITCREQRLPKNTAITLYDEHKRAYEIMKILHGVSHTLFNNLSHAVELPWEKYLSELHEFHEPGRDELVWYTKDEDIECRWATITIIIDSAFPDAATILFGAALSTFTDRATPGPCGEPLNKDTLRPEQTTADSGWLVYYVCPNNEVMYTRAAGALMTPLSTSEYEQRQRVRDLLFV